MIADPSQTARMCATNFVLSYGDELPGGDRCDQLTDAFTQVLLTFERASLPEWKDLLPPSRFQLAYDSARLLLEDLLESLHRRLDSSGRFGWRIQLCRLLLDYMQQRYGSDQSLACMMDYYMLLNRAINHANILN